ncbi:MAG TPA: hypothetical protein VJ925_12170 [Longimicrobiales bacterium]|nr:hypothetical protein [Longimicrobiales bacterium]
MNDTTAAVPLRRRIGAALPLLLLALLAVGGCASTGSSTSGPRNEITREQLAEMPEASAYDAIRRLNGRWLRPRPGGGSVAVYINNQRDTDGVDALRSYRSGEIQKIEYFDARRATTRWGTGHSSGAIVLTLF